MAITYSQSYTNARVSTFGDLTDVVVSYYCVVTGVDDSGISSSAGFDVSLPNADPASFIQFNSLTKEIFDTWTANYGSANIASCQIAISDVINAVLNAPQIKPLPFE